MLQLFTSYALEPLLESDYHDSKGLDVGWNLLVDQKLYSLASKEYCLFGRHILSDITRKNEAWSQGITHYELYSHIDR
jgi:hypothetical protein